MVSDIFSFSLRLGELSSNHLRPKVCFAICLPSTILNHKRMLKNAIVSMMGETSEDFFQKDMLGGGKVGKTRQQQVLVSSGTMLPG